MALYGLLDFDPNDNRSVEQWALWHHADHVEIQQAQKTATGTNNPIYEIFPFDLHSWGVWSLKHQHQHDDMNLTAKISGTDLTQVDFKNKEQRDSWHANHFREHMNIRSTYGI